MPAAAGLASFCSSAAADECSGAGEGRTTTARQLCYAAVGRIQSVYGRMRWGTSLDER